ncbi:hypothetical protein LTR86_008449 [Recurvomyces mirabilis]|nr:hypothetical protein LTR86_008449 [Recurvomyces mirabilis]
MNSHGHLTKAGWLHEGNFSEWEERMLAVCIASDLASRHAGTLECLTHDPLLFSCFQRPRLESVRLVMLQNVSLSLKARIPQASRYTARSLYAALSLLARPFRFLDLPMEVRAIVCELVVNGEAMRVRAVGKVYREHEFFPPLLYACRQIRAEVLPIFYQGSMFEYDKSGPRGLSPMTHVQK